MSQKIYGSLLAGALLIVSYNFSYAQKGFVEVSAEEKAKLRATVEANPDNLEAHKAYLDAFPTADDARKEYEQWMIKYPKSATIPRALGDKYSAYSPNAAQYWVKAIALDPKNVEVLKKLSFDASLRGDKAKDIEYLEKAMAADPEDLSTKVSYVFKFSDNKKLFRQKAFEFVDKYPTSEGTITILNIYGTYSNDKKEKMEVWERLRSLFPNEKSVPFMVAMVRLGDVYIQTGQYAKAIELFEALNGKAEERLGFASKLALAKTLAEAEKKMKAGKYADAKDILLPIDRQDRNYRFAGSELVLLKASALDLTGSTQAAYDSLLVFQGKTPSPEVGNALKKYGSKLGKDAARIKKDIRSVVTGNSKAALPFELDQYASGGKVKLEDFKGKVVLLSFWYPACGPCRGEMPHIEAAIKGIDKSKMVYLGVNGLRGQDDFVLPFMKGTRFSFTPLGGNEQILKDYAVRAFPTNYVIDQEGRIAYSGFMIGAESEEMLTMMIESLL